MPCTKDISFNSSLTSAMVLKSTLSYALSTLIFTVVVILKVLSPSFLQRSSEVASCGSDYRLKPDWAWISWTQASLDCSDSLHCCVPELSLDCWWRITDSLTTLIRIVIITQHQFVGKGQTVSSRARPMYVYRFFPRFYRIFQQNLPFISANRNVHISARLYSAEAYIITLL